MPIPKPKKDETQNQFSERCMFDPVMVSEYSDTDQRYAVCASAWKNSRTKNNVRQSFILNQEEYISKAIQNMSELVRKETLDSKEYLVAPVVMTPVGIMNGLLYTEDELAKFPESWNGRPVLYNHPEDKQTAGRPEIKEAVEIGTVYNSRFEDNKLKGEVWLDVEKCEKICPAILFKLNNNEMIEVSTGLFADCIEEKGTFNNESYFGKAVNIRPDHLALLPFDIGASSIADGAGMPRINKDTNNGENTMSNEKKSLVQKVKEMLGFSGTLENKKSFSQIGEELRNLLKAKENISDTDYLFTDEIFPESVIYVVEKNGQSGQMKSVGYAEDADGNLQLVGEPVDVQMELIYKRKDDGTIVNDKQTGEETMEKETIVNSLIESGKFEETDRDSLLAMNEDILKKMSSFVTNKEDGSKAEEDGGEPKAEKQTDVAPEAEEGAEAGKTVNNVEQYLENAPDAIRETLKAGLAKLEAEKNDLIQNILKAKGCAFSEDQLKAKELAELSAINSLIQPEKDYSGKAGNVDAPVIGNKADIDDEPLTVPSIIENKDK